MTDPNERMLRLKELLEENPADDFVTYAIAQEHQKSGELEAAIHTFEKLKERNPEYVGLYYHLAACYTEKDESERAMEIYEEGMLIAKKQADFHALSELQNARTNLELEL